MTIQSIIALAKTHKKQVRIGAVVLFFVIILAVRAFGNNDTVSVDDSPSSVSLIALDEIKDAQTLVNATGEVESLEQVELKSEVAARVTAVRVAIGGTVRAGQILVQFDNAVLAAQRSQAYAGLQAAQAGLVQVQAGVDTQQAVLQDLVNGPRSEDLNIAQSMIDAAEKNYAEAQKGFANATEKASVDLDASYAGALAAAQKAIAVGESALYTYSNLQQTHFPAGSVEELSIQSSKAHAVELLLGAQNAGRWTTDNLVLLQGGAKGSVATAQRDGNHEHIEQAIAQTLASLQALGDMYGNMPIKDSFSSTEVTSFTTQRQTVLAEIMALAARRDAIEIQRRGNESLLQSAQAAVVAAQNARVSAQEQFQKVQAGASTQQIQAQSSQLKQASAGFDAQRAQVLNAQAQLAAINAQLAKTVIRTPISGTVAVLPARVGELYSPGQLVASVVNTNGLQVTAFIDSSALSSISKGNTVFIGDSVTGTVHHIAPSIDPQTKKVEVIVVLSQPENAGLVVGQFVDIAIAANAVDGTPIIRLPLRAIRVQNDVSYVYSLGEDNVVEQHPVQTGRVIGEEIEVVSGLEDIATILSSVRGVTVGKKVDVRSK